mgnify:CR=1 FL=1
MTERIHELSERVEELKEQNLSLAANELRLIQDKEPILAKLKEKQSRDFLCKCNCQSLLLILLTPKRVYKAE